MVEPDETIPGLLVSEGEPSEEDRKAWAWQRVERMKDEALREVATDFRPNRAEALQLAIIWRLDMLISEIRAQARKS